MSDRYSRTRHLSLCLAAASVAAGCESTAPRPQAVALDVQDSRIGSQTAFVVRNTGTEVAFVSRCGDHVLPEVERRAGNDWINAAAALCPAISPMVPARLEAGAVLRDSVTIPRPGTYRLRVGIQLGSPSAGSEVVASPSFTVE